MKGRLNLMEEVVVVSAVRTPVGKIGGALKDILPEDLAALVLREAIRRAGLNLPVPDEVIFGHAKQSSDTPNIARLTALQRDYLLRSRPILYIASVDQGFKLSLVVLIR